ncbi:MAG: hypothetical protein J5J00_02020 [Deltaproteobacteria bacterium]|nr:hypothetical protein [Deltaproteobacteria bacterium]
MSGRVFQYFSLTIFSVLLLICSAAAQDLRKVQVSWKEGAKTKKRGIYCSGITPGSAKEINGALNFTSFTSAIKSIKSKKGSKGKLALLKRLNSLGKRQCRKDSAPGTPSPTPAPTLGNFDAFGNVTAQGKAAFGIPSIYSGNVSQGKALYQSICIGCHVERVNWSFPALRSAIAQSPMFYDESRISNSDLANITAYLNRFRIS